MFCGDGLLFINVVVMERQTDGPWEEMNLLLYERDEDLLDVGN